MTVDYRVGDTRDVIAGIPDGSVSLVACSPPFIALRSYLPADHPDKHREIGSEPDPGTFLQTLLALTADWGRVLAPWGSIAIELGDTYSGSGGAGGLRDGQGKADGSGRRQRAADVAAGILAPLSRPGPAQRDSIPAWPMPKSLALVPQAYALSLAYGRNVLNGNPSPAGQWRVRNQIVWHRPNPAVGALGDKVRPSTSYITVATRSAKRWYDLTAVRTPSDYERNTVARATAPGKRPNGCTDSVNAAGAPPLDCWFDEYDYDPALYDFHDTWTITTQPSQLAHYAMWPAKLAERIVLMMCPEHVCATCGEPRRRIERTERTFSSVTESAGISAGALGKGGPLGSIYSIDRETVGWTDCGHDNYRPGRVLDPFAGTGTTLAVADLHARDAIGIDIDPRNPLLYERRRAECARNLFGSPIPDTNQPSLFGETA